MFIYCDIDNGWYYMGFFIEKKIIVLIIVLGYCLLVNRSWCFFKNYF